MIRGCLSGQRIAQREVYNRYASVMLPVARRYVSIEEDAEDVLVKSFYKVFSKIDTFSNNGSFEGWIRRIVINESLMLLRKKHPLKQALDLSDVNPMSFSMPASAVATLAEADIIQLLEELPLGYRTVFNLYVIEGYKHREIAEKLDISINTSKSQLILAKRRLREKLEKLGYERNSK